MNKREIELKKQMIKVGNDGLEIKIKYLEMRLRKIEGE